jgi:hypothetical protein
MRGKAVLGLSVACLILSMVAMAAIANAFPGQTTRVSVSSTGETANMAASQGAISANGRYIVFTTAATNLAGTMPGTLNVYRRDRTTGATLLVSVNNSGNPGLGSALSPSVSADGRYVAFAYTGNDLVSGDANNVMDVFFRDTLLGTTRLVSTSTLGVQGDQVSGFGGLHGARTISDDGRYVVFNSMATTLVSETNNGRQQIYRKDMTTGELLRVSVDANGAAGDDNSSLPAISGDGNAVVFRSESTNFSPLTLTHTSQIYVRNVAAGTTTLESVTTAGVVNPSAGSSAPAISFDGNVVAFESAARLDDRDLDNGTLDVYVRDRASGTTVLASNSTLAIAGAPSRNASVSGDGRYVGFNSLDDKLVSPDVGGFTDSFRYDRSTGAIVLVSRNDADQQANNHSGGASLSFDGGLVVFQSSATNLVGTDSLLSQLYLRSLVSNVAPVVDAGPDETVNEGQWLKRFGSFTDTDGSMSWTGTYDFGAGPSALGIDPVKKMWFFQHEPLVPGTYTVTLSITDDAGATGTDTFRHTVENVPPAIQGLSGEDTIYFGATFRRNVFLADPGQSWPVPDPAETYSATVDYGDGTGTTALSGSYFTLEHTYARAGTYVITMTAADSNGGRSTASHTVHVLNYRFDWLVDGFVVGRNLPVKFTVHAPDGTFILDRDVWVDVVDVHGNVVLGPYNFGEQPSRAITASSDAYHVHVDTRGFEPGTYRLRVHFASPSLQGEFSLSSNNATIASRAGLR